MNFNRTMNINIQKLMYELKPFGVSTIYFDEGIVSFEADSQYENDINTILDQHTNSEWTNPTKLKIFRKLEDNLNPLNSDFSILGFYKESPSYIRGRKYKARYICPDDDTVVVDKEFTDIRDGDGILIAIEATFNWYCEDSSIGLSKTEIVKNLNTYEAETMERNRRERQVDYLRAGAKGTPIEQYLLDLISHYSVEVESYCMHGTDDWLNAVNNETDPIMLSILGIAVPRIDDPNLTITVKESIIYQITGVLPE